MTIAIDGKVYEDSHELAAEQAKQGIETYSLSSGIQPPPVNPQLEDYKKLGRQVLEGAIDPFVKIGKIVTGQSENIPQDAAEAMLGLAGPKIGFGAIIGGLGAKTINKEMLALAQNLESRGLSDREILWRGTGFYKDADMRWKHEIPTQGTKLKEGVLDFVETPNDKSWASVSSPDAYKLNKEYKLPEVLDFPALYESYPHLKNVKVVPGDKAGASYDLDKTIALGPAGDQPSVRLSLLHEVQHAVQQYEGFSQGTNPAYMRQQTLKFLDDAIAKTSSLEEKDRLAYMRYLTERRVTTKGYDASWRLYRANPGEREANVVMERNAMHPEELKNESPIATMKFLEKAQPDNWPPELRLPKEESPGISSLVTIKDMTPGGTSVKLLAFDTDKGVKGNLSLSYSPESKQIFVNGIYAEGSKGGPGSVGPSDVRSILREIKNLYPEAESISGLRVTGARKRASEDSGDISLGYDRANIAVKLGKSEGSVIKSKPTEEDTHRIKDLLKIFK